MNKKREIVRIALKGFLEKGYTNVSLREIADEAEMKSASLYYHFKDKQALFEECAEAFFGEWNKWFETIISLDMSLKQIINQICVSLGQDDKIIYELYGAKTTIGQYHFILDAAYYFPHILQSMKEVNLVFLELLEQKITEAKEKQEIRQEVTANTVYYLLCSLLEGSNIMRFTDGNMNASDYGQVIFNIIWQGIKR